MTGLVFLIGKKCLLSDVPQFFINQFEAIGEKRRRIM